MDAINTSGTMPPLKHSHSMLALNFFYLWLIKVPSKKEGLYACVEMLLRNLWSGLIKEQCLLRRCQCQAVVAACVQLCASVRSADSTYHCNDQLSGAAYRWRHRRLMFGICGPGPLGPLGHSSLSPTPSVRLSSATF